MATESVARATEKQTDNVKNLVDRNVQYAAQFDKGDLALPPAKKYLVGMSQHSCMAYSMCTKLIHLAYSDLHGRSYRSSSCLRH